MVAARAGFPVFSSAYLDLTETILPLARETAGPGRDAPGVKRIRETVAHALWLEQPWGPFPVRDVTGASVEIISPGWLNGGAGPDFSGAVFRHGDGDPQRGDVEIHVRSSDWIRHKHHRDPAYNGVRLHAVLYCDTTAGPRMTLEGRPLIEIELGPLCAPLIERIRGELGAGPDPAGLAQVTGRCGGEFDRLGADKAAELLDAAGEGRLTLKSKRFAAAIRAGSGEQELYQGLLETLGYRAFKSQFARLAQRAPLESLRSIQVEVDRRYRPMVFQGVLFGLAGFLDGAGILPVQADGETVRHYAALGEVWREMSSRYSLASVMTGGDWPLKGSRPANYPMGRLAGLGRFLAEHVDTDLETLFARMMARFPVDGSGADRRAWTASAVSLFATPVEEYWAFRYTPGGRKLTRPRRLIGPDRINLFLINVAVPYFLARARRAEDRKAEKRLRAVFHKLAAPGTNSTVRFMTSRLFGGGPARRGFINGVRQQGLIQIYQDFCSANPKGCAGCRFAAYLSKLPA